MDRGGPIRVLIVDEDAATREELGAVCRSTDGIDLVGEAISGEEAIEMVESLAPDVVVSEVRFAGMSGIEATRVITGRRPETKVLLLTADDSRAAMRAGIEAGASGYVMKGIPPDDVMKSVKLVVGREGGDA